MLKNLKIGNINIENPVFLAPMVGVTDSPTREMNAKFGLGLSYSEMIASKAIINKSEKTIKMAQKKLNSNDYFAVQIVGNDPKIMAEAARINYDLGADLIDINMGCPVKKVTTGEAGAALMKNEKLAGEIIEAVAKAVPVPVTVKTRLGWDMDSLNAPVIAKLAQDAGAKAITIHGRTRSQLYNGEADWHAIKSVVEAVQIPVIGNGDVTSVEHAKQLLEKSNAKGIMIGRGTYGRPWFIAHVIHYLKTGEILSEPSITCRYEALKLHYNLIIEYYGESSGIKIARKHLGWYSKGIKNSAEFRAKINTVETSQESIDMIDSFFINAIEDEDRNN